MIIKMKKKVNEEIDLMTALDLLCAEKGLDKELIVKALEDALVAAYKKNFAKSYDKEGPRVHVVMERTGATEDSPGEFNGRIRVMAEKEVSEEVFEDEHHERITLEDAREINPNLEIGDFVSVEVTPKNFGRIAAMAAKNIVTQRIREAERSMILDEYTAKIGHLVTGSIQRIERGRVYIDIGNVEAELPEREQPKNEVYNIHDRLTCYVSDVKMGAKGSTRIIVSRTHPNMVKLLFTREVPEIEEGRIEIKGVSREAGSRSKIAVYSKEPGIDAQGACIGPKGIRVQKIVEELGDEKIDIVKWSEDPVEYITESLSPAKVIEVKTSLTDKEARVIVPENQLSLAIGKYGQNVRLAARLTGWKIDIISDAEAEEQKKAAENDEIQYDDIDDAAEEASTDDVSENEELLTD